MAYQKCFRFFSFVPYSHSIFGIILKWFSFYYKQFFFQKKNNSFSPHFLWWMVYLLARAAVINRKQVHLFQYLLDPAMPIDTLYIMHIVCNLFILLFFCCSFDRCIQKGEEVNAKNMREFFKIAFFLISIRLLWSRICSEWISSFDDEECIAIEWEKFYGFADIWPLFLLSFSLSLSFSLLFIGCIHWSLGLHFEK